MVKRLRGFGLVVAGSVLLSGCVQSAEEEAASEREQQEMIEEATGRGSSSDDSTANSSNCESMSDAMANAIAAGGEAGTGMKPVRSAAVKSPHFENVYFIAVEFSATGVDNQVGVWASNSLQPGGGVIMAVDGHAQQFTEWPDADSTDAQIGAADPSVQAAKGCLP